ncbi:MAG: GNAT family N-acetyltransferase [Kangiellaceae bacterium]
MHTIVREIKLTEYEELGKLMVDVYSNLQGFPKPKEQPNYYQMLEKVGSLNSQKNTKVLVAINNQEKLVGGIVYFSSMQQYGSGGLASQEKNSSGIRLLAVNNSARKQGVGKLLAKACIELAIESSSKQIILHTTDAMKVAWKMYENLGFKRYKKLDFLQEGLPVYGFRLIL